MANTGDLFKGAFIRYDNELCQVMEYQHRTPGNLRAFYQVVLRVLRTGKQIEHRFRSGEEIIFVRIEFKEMQFLYKENTSLVVMDTESYEQIYIDAKTVGEGIKFLKEEMMVKVSFEGDNVISVEPPLFVELVISYTEPGVKGDTANSALKPATLETGASIMVPLFCNTDDKIRIDTRTGLYMERATK
jgi:elongation factor P